MTILTFEKKQLEKRIGKLDAKMQDRITMFGTPVDKMDNTTISIEIFPNRPDLLSFEGFVRSFNAFLGKKNKTNYTTHTSKEKLIIEKVPKEWPYAFACIIKGLHFDDKKIKEIIDMQEKLAETFLRKRKKGGIGLYPLDKIKFPVRFKAMKPEEIKFQPLEFPRIITARQILTQHSTGREYAHICQDWTTFPVFIDAANTIMSMPPIINSHVVGKIDTTTKNIFLEATGTDPVALKNVINIMVTSLIDMGGKIYTIECVHNGKKIVIPNLSSEKKEFSIEFLNKNLGTSFSEKETKNLLEKMGIGFDKKKNKTYAIIPPYRTDILHQIDLAEELAV
ncbi:MAG: phenylalanine--tRNA ligase subunit beta, partial [Nanoarchaeota archaeon]